MTELTLTIETHDYDAKFIRKDTDSPLWVTDIDRMTAECPECGSRMYRNQGSEKHGNQFECINTACLTECWTTTYRPTDLRHRYRFIIRG